jgi:hypothetical protein
MAREIAYDRSMARRLMKGQLQPRPGRLEVLFGVADQAESSFGCQPAATES